MKGIDMSEKDEAFSNHIGFLQWKHGVLNPAVQAQRAQKAERLEREISERFQKYLNIERKDRDRGSRKKRIKKLCRNGKKELAEIILHLEDVIRYVGNQTDGSAGNNTVPSVAQELLRMLEGEKPGKITRDPKKEDLISTEKKETRSDETRTYAVSAQPEVLDRLERLLVLMEQEGRTLPEAIRGAEAER